jgi:general nucleoside transport system ATP-binding protein
MLSVRSVSKRFGPVLALDDVTLEFSPGEIHAVIGENGAGKSTLMGILAGFVEPTKGEVTFNGQPLPVGRPFECKKLGIGMVHQHFTLVGELTVAENLALSRVDSVYEALNLTALTRSAMDLAEKLGWQVDPGAKVKDLPVGVQQRIEILKALAGDAEVLIFDEPTAVLSPDEIEDLLRVLQELAGLSKTVILIAHKLREVLAVAQRISVLRRTGLMATVPRAEADERKLAEWMVGELPPELNRPTGASEPGLEVQGLWVRGDRGNRAVQDVSLTLSSGEVLGIGGVDGNGQVELAEALAQIRPVESGTMLWKGGPVDKVAIGYVPQDRHTEGLALRMSVKDNLLIGALERQDLAGSRILDSARIGTWAHEIVDRFSIKVDHIDDPVSSLSGGNQQKVVVGRVLDAAPSLLVVVNPTRGLDVRATEFVHRQLLAAKEAGTAVALFSTDLDELAALADRTVFMSGGRLSEALV